MQMLQFVLCSAYKNGSDLTNSSSRIQYTLYTLYNVKSYKTERTHRPYLVSFHNLVPMIS